MENASRALVIAGGVLIAILVISLLVTGWNNLTHYSRVQEEIESAEQIAEFNREFESYNKTIVRGYELISLENLVEDTNTRYSTSNGYKKIEFYIKLLKGTTLVENLGDSKTTKKVTESYVDIATFFSKLLKELYTTVLIFSVLKTELEKSLILYISKLSTYKSSSLFSPFILL